MQHHSLMARNVILKTAFTALECWCKVFHTNILIIYEYSHRQYIYYTKNLNQRSTLLLLVVIYEEWETHICIKTSEMFFIWRENNQEWLKRRLLISFNHPLFSCGHL